MFERFTDRARRVVVLAQEEARRLNHDYIGTEHLLLGLIDEADGLAAQALQRLEIPVEVIRARFTEMAAEGGPVPSGHIPFTPRAKKVLELSLREALNLGHNYIGTEHLLLGLAREGKGVAAQALERLGADLGHVRQEVLQLLKDPGAVERAETVTPTQEPYTVITPLAPEDMPGCPRCQRSLTRNLAWKTLEAAGPEGDALQTRVFYCRRCGRALGVDAGHQ